jgi:hypothetical protein
MDHLQFALVRDPGLARDVSFTPGLQPPTPMELGMLRSVQTGMHTVAVNQAAVSASEYEDEWCDEEYDEGEFDESAEVNAVWSSRGRGEEEVLEMLEEGLDLEVDQGLDLEEDLDLEGDLVLEGLVVDLNPVQEVVFKEEVVKVVAEQGWILIDHQGKVLVVGS